MLAEQSDVNSVKGMTDATNAAGFPYRPDLLEMSDLVNKYKSHGQKGDQGQRCRPMLEPVLIIPGL